MRNRKQGGGFRGFCVAVLVIVVTGAILAGGGYAAYKFVPWGTIFASSGDDGENPYQQKYQTATATIKSLEEQIETLLSQVVGFQSQIATNNQTIINLTNQLGTALSAKENMISMGAHQSLIEEKDAEIESIKSNLAYQTQLGQTLSGQFATQIEQILSLQAQVEYYRELLAGGTPNTPITSAMDGLWVVDLDDGAPTSYIHIANGTATFMAMDWFTEMIEAMLSDPDSLGDGGAEMMLFMLEIFESVQVSICLNTFVLTQSAIMDGERWGEMGQFTYCEDLDKFLCDEGFAPLVRWV